MASLHLWQPVQIYMVEFELAARAVNLFAQIEKMCDSFHDLYRHAVHIVKAGKPGGITTRHSASFGLRKSTDGRTKAQD